MNKKIVFGIIITIVIFIAGLRSNHTLQYRESANGMDVWEYQTVAINLSEFNRFPVMGYLESENRYQLDKLRSNAIDDYFKCRFTNQGPVTYVGKPPLYSLALGATYNLFQPDLKYGYYLNVFLFGGILLLLLFIGHALNNTYGFLLGLAASVLYTCYGSHDLPDILPASLLTFISCCIALVSIYLLRSFSLKHFIAIGMLLGIGMLTKGNIIFIILFIPLCLFIIFRGYGKIGSKLAIMIAAFVLVLLPWVIYANMLRINNKNEWTEWKNKIVRTESECVLDTTKIEAWDSRENRKEIVRNNEHHKIVSHLYSRTANADVPIVISNQATSDEVLSVHNEYTVDGDWHPEWRFRSNAVYNTNYLDKPYLVKILCFYWDNPTLLFKIALAKMMRTTSLKFSFFLLSAFLFGCFMWFRKIKHEKKLLRLAFVFVSVAVFAASLFLAPRFHIIYATLFFFSGLLFYRRTEMKILPFIFPAFIVNCYLIVVIFYGHSRFVNFIDPLTIFSSLYCIFLIISDLVKNGTEQPTPYPN